jgi:hypothetical protein
VLLEGELRMPVQVAACLDEKVEFGQRGGYRLSAIGYRWRDLTFTLSFPRTRESRVE